MFIALCGKSLKMPNRKFKQFKQYKEWLLWSLFFITLFKGNHCSNVTEIEKNVAIANNIITNKTFNLITPGLTSQITEKVSENTTDIWIYDSESTTAGIKISQIIANKGDLVEIFHETGLNSSDNVSKIPVNVTIITNRVNVSYEKESWNETVKTNYTLMAEAVGSALEEEAPFWLQKSVAVGAGIFLVSAVLGYFSCVGYRRFLQRKYGNSQILVAEEVYDTTDLRYFEI